VTPTSHATKGSLLITESNDKRDRPSCAGDEWAEAVSRTRYDELSELAVMSAFGTWLRRWQPIAIHGAMLASARPEAIMGAMGNSMGVAFERWPEWAVAQRDFIVNGEPGVTEEEYETVAGGFAAIGIKPAA
jgi:hypothetical protein